MLAFAATLAIGLGTAHAADDSRYLAAGFTALAHDARIVVMPIDVELSSISAGGVNEPKADWTAAARDNMKTTLDDRVSKLGLNAQFMDDSAAEEFDELIGLQTAVARSIALHHGLGGAWALPTKQGRLDWSFDDSMKPLAQKTGARYGLFIWVRDSYASGERVAAMIGLALLGVAVQGGVQTGYASLVDLDSGRVLWFNRLMRGSGDLRDAPSAAESIQALMHGFPVVR
jgi:hypothetical protein